MPQIQLPDFKLHYTEQGSGDDVIVFVHGFVSSHRWWLPTLAQLPESYHAYAIDLRGCGESEAPESGYTLAQYADDIEAFAVAQGLEKFTLVGHSMGGGVSMQYALNHPERLKALVLVSPLAPFGMVADKATVDWLNAVQGQADGQRMVVLGAFATPPTGDYLDQLVADAVGWDKPVYLGTMDDMAAYDVSDLLPSLAVPTLVTWGDKDTVIPFAGIVDAFTKIPNCNLEIWHGVGHSGPIEIPERFVRLLATFMAESAQV